MQEFNGENGNRGITDEGAPPPEENRISPAEPEFPADESAEGDAPGTETDAATPEPADRPSENAEETAAPEPARAAEENSSDSERTVEYESSRGEPAPAVYVNLNPPKVHAKNTGFRIFVIILAALLTVSVAVSAAYIFTRRGGGKSPGALSTPLAGTPAGGEPSEAQKVYADCVSSVVGIMIYTDNAQYSPAQASGVVYADGGYIVTNDHIYADIPKPKFKIRTAGGEIYDAEYVAGDTRSDIAVLKTDAPGLKKATFATSDGLAVGEEVITIGYPAGIYEKAIMTGGTVSSAGRRITSASTSYSVRLIQTDAAINPGNSGGALLNLYGQVVGITSSKLVGDSYDRVGFAVPADTAVKIADSLINNGHVEGRARLGISYTSVDLVSAEIAGCPAGLQVAEISAESDLYGKNLEAGDIITHINNTEITDSTVALDIIDASKPGDSVTLTVYKTKTGQTATLTATMLNDAGSSSYTTVAPNAGTSSDGAESGGQNPNPFDFPFGE